MNDELNDFFQQKVNYAIVINCTLETVDHLKRLLSEENIHVIYQKTSISKLIIHEEEGLSRYE